MTLERIEIVFTADGIPKVRRDMVSLARDTKEAGKETSFLKQALAAIATIQTVRTLAAISDGYVAMTNRLRLVTRETETLADVQARVLKVANDTRISLTLTGENYARLTLATKHLNASSTDVARALETVNKAVRVGGALASEAEAGLIQFSQGLASNRLAGDELKSVLEGLPRLGKAIADGLGVPFGKLRELGAEQKLSAEAVFKALLDQAPVLDREFSLAMVSIGEGILKVKNSAIGLALQMEAMLGLTDKVSRVFILLADNLHGVAAGFAVATVAAASYAVHAGYAGIAAGILYDPVILLAVGVKAVTLAMAANPFGLALAGITAAALGLSLLVKNSEEAEATLTTFFAQTLPAFGRALPVAVGIPLAATAATFLVYAVNSGAAAAATAVLTARVVQLGVALKAAALVALANPLGIAIGILVATVGVLAAGIAYMNRNTRESKSDFERLNEEIAKGAVVLAALDAELSKLGLNEKTNVAVEQALAELEVKRQSLQMSKDELEVRKQLAAVVAQVEGTPGAGPVGEVQRSLIEGAIRANLATERYLAPLLANSRNNVVAAASRVIEAGQVLNRAVEEGRLTEDLRDRALRAEQKRFRASLDPLKEYVRELTKARELQALGGTEREEADAIEAFRARSGVVEVLSQEEEVIRAVVRETARLRQEQDGLARARANDPYLKLQGEYLEQLQDQLRLKDALVITEEEFNRRAVLISESFAKQLDPVGQITERLNRQLSDLTLSGTQQDVNRTLAEAEAEVRKLNRTLTSEQRAELETMAFTVALVTAEAKAEVKAREELVALEERQIRSAQKYLDTTNPRNKAAADLESTLKGINLLLQREVILTEEAARARRRARDAAYETLNPVESIIANLQKDIALQQLSARERAKTKTFQTTLQKLEEGGVNFAELPEGQQEALVTLSAQLAQVTEQQSRFKDLTDEVDRALIRAFEDGTGAMAEFFVTGEAGAISLSKLFRQLAIQLANIALQQLALKPFLSLVGISVPSASAAATPLSSASAAPGFQVVGGAVVKSAMGNVFTSPSITQIAEGGEAEGVFPLKRGRDGKLGIRVTEGGSSGGGPRKLEVNFRAEVTVDSRGGGGNSGADPQAIERAGQALGAGLERKMLRILADQRRPGGILYGAG